MPPFTGSDVPLEEDILKKKIPYNQTYFEWLSRGGEYRTFNQIQTAAATSTATIPVDKVFILLSISHFSDHAGGAAGNDVSSVAIDGVGQISKHLHLRPASDQAVSVFNFSIPLILTSGSKIRLTQSNNNMTSTVDAIGFVLDKKLF